MEVYEHTEYGLCLLIPMDRGTPLARGGPQSSNTITLIDLRSIPKESWDNFYRVYLTDQGYAEVKIGGFLLYTNQGITGISFTEDQRSVGILVGISYDNTRFTNAFRELDQSMQ